MSTLAGRVLYRCYHRPVGFARDLIRDGGPLERRRTTRGRFEMERSVRDLPPPATGPGPELSVHLLTGNRFWYQTAFCLWTFARQALRTLAPVIHDDGTLAGWQKDELTRLFPAARFRSHEDTVRHLETALPSNRFPVLRDRWQHYANIRKLINPHLGAMNGWKLVLDSDLLFFRSPDFLIEWLACPTTPLHAVDCETSYGYTKSLLEAVAGTPLAERVNVGLCGLNSAELDWEKLEHWCRLLIEHEGTHYYLEQALVAMLVAGRTCAVAPAESYVTYPRAPETRDCRAVMHHYVANSKRWYFQENWRRAIRSDGASASNGASSPTTSVGIHA